MRNIGRSIGLSIGLVLGIQFGAQSLAQDLLPPRAAVPAPRPDYSPYVDDHFPNRVLFGDTHLHTMMSTDAGMLGAVVTPEDAYRVSRGDEIISNTGQRVKLVRPLDFVVIADHAENLGLPDFIARSDPILLENEAGKRWHDLVKAGNGFEAFLEWVASPEDQINEPMMARSAWARMIEAAETFNQPGVFTALIGFEWTSMALGNNLHRNVIFRDDGDRASQVVPFSQLDSPDPEDLWKYMAAYEEATGGRMQAIPHNGNLSNGRMFDTVTFDGNPLTKEWAETRMRFERIVEVTQPKGDGEAHPLLSPDDEFADFETLDEGNVAGTAAKTEDMLPKEYARAALKQGLALEKELGENPFKFGMVGGTDAHTGIPTTREENNFSKASFVEPSAERWEHVMIKGRAPGVEDIMQTDIGASGLSAVWARENTRKSLWDAMARRETYATTGTRILVRVFAGWDFEEDEVHRPDFAREGYRRGVPMGGDLSAAPAGKAPTIMVRALRDPDGANLDRIQIIKGWMDANGDLKERIYDIAVSDGRTIDADGRSRTPVGNTVDVKDAYYTNTIGDALLGGHWVDPEFDPAQSAFYYARVLEIPTPRWTAYDAKFFDVEMPEGTVMQLQDRAYTSPIWYSPGG
jgi:hypothetical protein